ncbi:hypothetical protein [Pontibaca methylaminivorans]|nr:hypothetical protein [Pontibaca methylaminivorans]
MSWILLFGRKGCNQIAQAGILGKPADTVDDDIRRAAAGGVAG